MNSYFNKCTLRVKNQNIDQLLKDAQTWVHKFGHNCTCPENVLGRFYFIEARENRMYHKHFCLGGFKLFQKTVFIENF